MDISKQKVELNCSSCKSTIEVTLKQVADESTISCKCGHTIKLSDKDGSAKKTIKDFNKAFDDLDNSLKGLF
jgi:hypothetical protein